MISLFPSPVEQPLEFLLAYYPNVAKRNEFHRAAGREPGKVSALFPPQGSRQLIMCLIAIGGMKHDLRGRKSRIKFRKHVDSGHFGDKHGANQQGAPLPQFNPTVSVRFLMPGYPETP